MHDLNRRGLVLLGCGKMGSALLQGWLARGVAPDAVTILDPAPAPWLQDHPGLLLNSTPPEAPAVVLVAVKPQALPTALPQLAGLAGGETLFLSIAAGIPLQKLADLLGAPTPIIRAMPNTPAAVGRGISALIGNAEVSVETMALAEELMGAVGETVRLEREAQMDAVTGLSGSGPAYVFHLIECMAAAGVAEGLAPELAMALARSTVAGAGALAAAAEETPAQLRVNVTSPAGTTEAGLRVLMDPDRGLPPLVAQTVAAATARARELGQ